MAKMRNFDFENGSLVAKLLHMFKMAELPEIDLEVITVFVHELLI